MSKKREDKLSFLMTMNEELETVAEEKYYGTIEYLEENFTGLYTIENEGDVMVYRYTRWGAFDLHGLFADLYMMTTYDDNGLKCCNRIKNGKWW